MDDIHYGVFIYGFYYIEVILSFPCGHWVFSNAFSASNVLDNAVFLIFIYME